MEMIRLAKRLADGSMMRVNYHRGPMDVVTEGVPADRQSRWDGWMDGWILWRARGRETFAVSVCLQDGDRATTGPNYLVDNYANDPDWCGGAKRPVDTTRRSVVWCRSDAEPRDHHHPPPHRSSNAIPPCRPRDTHTHTHTHTHLRLARLEEDPLVAKTRR